MQEPNESSSTPSRPSPWRRRARSWAINIAILFAAFLAAHLWQTRNMASGQAPEVQFERAVTAGNSQTLTQWRQQHAGEPVVLYFWATWCPICKLEQGSVDALVQKYPVLPIAMQSGPASTVAAYEQKSGLRWNSAMDPQGDIARTFGVNSTPSFIILAPDGTISSRTVGLTSNWGLQLRLLWARIAG
ncbi:redoxin domain-containing protein [Brachymonas denitrificans]|uniref:redoxin domain-containing protein n=1 Tax=Brachymonas denitrificans TaxID=28220 RepID=UPI003220940B